MITTALTVRRARRVDLGWNTMCQHRLALIGLAIVFAGFGLRLALTAGRSGDQPHSARDGPGPGRRSHRRHPGNRIRRYPVSHRD
ncbi:MAG TPA: hypothetical protein VMU94_23020 [Streptosporangiaceae bacterium]|nr:hypothetical protein [Streptosporangiaceae bacterium]